MRDFFMGVAVTLVVASLLRRLWARYTMLRLIRSRPNEVVVPIPPGGGVARGGAERSAD